MRNLIPPLGRSRSFLSRARSRPGNRKRWLSKDHDVLCQGKKPRLHMVLGGYVWHREDQQRRTFRSNQFHVQMVRDERCVFCLSARCYGPNSARRLILFPRLRQQLLVYERMDFAAIDCSPLCGVLQLGVNLRRRQALTGR
jgi:hypothetical protein